MQFIPFGDVYQELNTVLRIAETGLEQRLDYAHMLVCDGDTVNDFLNRIYYLGLPFPASIRILPYFLCL